MSPDVQAALDTLREKAHPWTEEISEALDVLARELERPCVCDKCRDCLAANGYEAERARADRLAALLAKTIYNPPGWTGPDVWWAKEARAALAEHGSPEEARP